MTTLPDRIENPGADLASPAEALGLCLRDYMAEHKDFYFFSPDETTSNKLDAVFEATDRAWNLPKKPWDKYLNPDGRVIEMLSENTLFSMMQGHILSSRPAALASYEAFLPIIMSQLDQYLKFLAQSAPLKWRPKVPALNLLSTSTCWRQDHNGFSHQNPALISNLLTKPSNLANCLFPIDDIAANAAWEFMTKTKNVVNLTTFNKSPEPRWIDYDHARFQLTNGGASIFQFASDENPDIIITAAGDIVSREALYAIKLVKKSLPNLKLRFVGLAALSHGAIGTTENKLLQSTFDEYFTQDKPIVANFHGYPETLKSILTRYAAPSRLSVHGFIDQGSTTTPFDMLSRNRASRYHLAASILKSALAQNLLDTATYEKFINFYALALSENIHHAQTFGLDSPAITDFHF
jgi:xylulose-5-phosphate/fructose-6-phosphate phosphoketolase